MGFTKRIGLTVALGLIIGEIFLLPDLGWLYGGHGFISPGWIQRFVIVGAAWGILCGASIPLLQELLKVHLIFSGLAALVVGGFSGVAFYLIGTLPFFPLAQDTLFTVLRKCISGLVIGAAVGLFCILLLRTLLFERVRSPGLHQNKTVQNSRHSMTHRLLSACTLLVSAVVVGGAMLTLVGQAKLYLSGGLWLWEVSLFAMPFILLDIGSVIYGFIKPLPEPIVQHALRGLSDGVAFAILSVFYFLLLSQIVSTLNVPKPYFLTDEVFANFVLGVSIVYTFLFSLVCGMMAGIFEGLLSNRQQRILASAADGFRPT